MTRRLDRRLAISLAALMITASGCSQRLPTSSDRAGAQAVPSGFATSMTDRVDLSVGAVTFIVPEASGTIRKLPELGTFEAVSGDMQSSYFRTTDANREFRRGFAEFVIPRFRDVFGARIDLRQNGTPNPRERHELSRYTDVDLIVNTSDYDRTSLPVGTFATGGDAAFDLTRLVAASRGGRIGFGMKMEADPAETGFRPMGTGFGRHSTPCGVRIEVTTTPTEANELLQALVLGMGLRPALEARLLLPLRRIGELLTDGDPDNDAAACGTIRGFLDDVTSLTQRDELAAEQSWDLVELGRNLITCHRGRAQVRVFRDFATFEAATRRLVEVDFEPGHGRGGVSFIDPHGPTTGFCSSPTCSPDSDNPDGGNIAMSLNSGSRIEFPGGTNAVMLVVEGMGHNPFQVQIVDSADDATLVDGAGVSFGVAFLGFISPNGIPRIDITSVGGTGGPLEISALYFGGASKGTIRRNPAEVPRSLSAASP